MNYKLLIHKAGGDLSVQVEEGANLFHILKDNGCAPASPCGGRGVCGKCKVLCGGLLSPVTEEEKALFDEERLRDGWRLSCVTKICGDAWVTAPETSKPDICADFEEPSVDGRPMFEKYGAAKGSFLAVKRILKCHPFHKGGYDPLK